MTEEKDQSYVCEIRPETNEVVIGDNTDTYTDKIFCKNISHMAVDNLEDCKNVTAKIRYGSKAVPCKIEYVDKDKIKCCFSEKIRAATPGQAAVFYQNDVVLGGGVIV